MDITYKKYLDQGTGKLRDLLSSSELSEEERKYIADKYSEQLVKGLFDTDDLNDLDQTIYGASLSYIDEKISWALANKDLTYRAYENVISLCGRQKKLINLFSKQKWSLPSIQNSDIDKCEKELIKKQETGALIKEIKETDEAIDRLFEDINHELDLSKCDLLLDALNTLDEDLKICRKKKIAVPTLNNGNTEMKIETVKKLRKTAEKKEEVYKQIRETDENIDHLLSLSVTSPKEWKKLTTLCQAQLAQIKDCRKNGWGIPGLKYAHPEALEMRSKHYLMMSELDNKLSATQKNLKTQSDFKQFFDNCEKQTKNIETCKKNDWAIPTLVNSDIEKLLGKAHGEKSKRNRRDRFKRKVLRYCGIFLIAVLLVLYFSIRYKMNRVQVPFDSVSVRGRDFESVYSELQKAGFTNITKKRSDAGVLESNKVIDVTIGNSSKYDAGKYILPGKSVVITYSSENRICVNELLKDWKEKNQEELVQRFKDAGFSEILVTTTTTDKPELDQKITYITLNWENYSGQECYISKDSQIIIDHYDYRIALRDSNQYIGKDYNDVVKSLKERGFTNVQTKKVTTGWKKGNSVIGVSATDAGQVDNYRKYKPDTKIVVSYSSNDRVDVTTILSNWKSKEYSVVKQGLAKKGFTHIKTKEIQTNNKELDKYIQGIKINEDNYSGGECHIQKDSQILIQYYVTKVRINKAAADIKGENYEELMSELKKKGFTNIQLLRGNDLWFFASSNEGKVKSITVNGNEDFSETDAFNLDDPIVITVHTFITRGCEDITDIAE